MNRHLNIFPEKSFFSCLVLYYEVFFISFYKGTTQDVIDSVSHLHHVLEPSRDLNQHNCTVYIFPMCTKM